MLKFLYTIIVHNCARIGGKSTQNRQVLGINDIYKFLLPEAVYKLLISEHLSLYISVLSLVVRAPSIGKL